MPRYALLIDYHGGPFAGWQRQADHPSVQQAVEEAILASNGKAAILKLEDGSAGLVEAIAANLPGAVWQRCRTHYAANLMSVTPKSMWPAVKAMLHSVYDQPDATAVNAQFERLLDYVSEKLPAVAEHLIEPVIEQEDALAESHRVHGQATDVDPATGEEIDDA